MKSVIVSNKAAFEKKLAAIKNDGRENFFVVSDFDGTLTKMFYRGKPRPSVISILRSESLISSDYSRKAQELYEKYHTIEIDEKIPIEERMAAMENWWKDHYKLLISSGLRKEHIEKVVNSKKLKLRRGVDKLLKLLSTLEVPVIIMSSSGVGYDAISLLLMKKDAFFDNILIISNRFVWRGDKAVSFHQPIVHSLNKNFKFFPEVLRKIQNRRNALLLGNNVDDVKMIQGADIKECLKIGFLDEKSNLKIYEKNFDVVILDDGSMGAVVRLVEEMFK